MQVLPQDSPCEYFLLSETLIYTKLARFFLIEVGLCEKW